MKKKSIWISVVVGLTMVVALAFGASLITRNMTGDAAMVANLINPFVPMEDVYVKSADVAGKQPDREWQDQAKNYKDYSYNVRGYYEDGRSRQVELNVIDGKFKNKAPYLKVNTKGLQSRYFEYVQKDAVPAAALEAMGD